MAKEVGEGLGSGPVLLGQMSQNTSDGGWRSVKPDRQAVGLIWSRINAWLVRGMWFGETSGNARLNLSFLLNARRKICTEIPSRSARLSVADAQSDPHVF